MEVLLADLMYWLPGLIVVGAMILILSFVVVILACNTGKTTKLTKEEKRERETWRALLHFNPHYKEEFVAEMEARARCGLITQEEANKAIKEMYESYDRAYKN